VPWEVVFGPRVLRHISVERDVLHRREVRPLTVPCLPASLSGCWLGLPGAGHASSSPLGRGEEAKQDLLHPA